MLTGYKYSTQYREDTFVCCSQVFACQAPEQETNLESIPSNLEVDNQNSSSTNTNSAVIEDIIMAHFRGAANKTLPTSSAASTAGLTRSTRSPIMTLPFSGRSVASGKRTGAALSSAQLQFPEQHSLSERMVRFENLCSLGAGTQQLTSPTPADDRIPPSSFSAHLLEPSDAAYPYADAPLLSNSSSAASPLLQPSAALLNQSDTETVFVLLEWSAPPNPNGGHVLHYELHIEGAIEGVQASFEVLPATHFTFTHNSHKPTLEVLLLMCVFVGHQLPVPEFPSSQ